MPKKNKGKVTTILPTKETLKRLNKPYRDIIPFLHPAIKTLSNHFPLSSIMSQPKSFYEDLWKMVIDGDRILLIDIWEGNGNFDCELNVCSLKEVNYEELAREVAVDMANETIYERYVVDSVWDFYKLNFNHKIIKVHVSNVNLKKIED